MSELSSLSPTAYVLGAASLYLGFSGVLGVLLRYANQHRTVGSWLLGVGYAGLLFLPATAFVIQRSGWPVAIRLGVFLLSMAVAMLAVLQPVWTPRTLWRPKFGRRYFAAAMALSAVWGLSLGISTGAIFPVLVGISAVAAAAASLTFRQNPT